MPTPLLVSELPCTSTVIPNSSHACCVTRAVINCSGPAICCRRSPAIGIRNISAPTAGANRTSKPEPNTVTTAPKNTTTAPKCQSVCSWFRYPYDQLAHPRIISTDPHQRRRRLKSLRRLLRLQRSHVITSGVSRIWPDSSSVYPVSAMSRHASQVAIIAMLDKSRAGSKRCGFNVHPQWIRPI